MKKLSQYLKTIKISFLNIYYVLIYLLNILQKGILPKITKTSAKKAGKLVVNLTKKG